MGDGEKSPLWLSFNPNIQLESRSVAITSDAGLLAFRGLEDSLSLTRIAADYLRESRTGRNIWHHMVPLLRHPSTAALMATMTPTMPNVFPKTQS